MEQQQRQKLINIIHFILNLEFTSVEDLLSLVKKLIEPIPYLIHFRVDDNSVSLSFFYSHFETEK